MIKDKLDTQNKYYIENTPELQEFIFNNSDIEWGGSNDQVVRKYSFGYLCLSYYDDWGLYVGDGITIPDTKLTLPQFKELVSPNIKSIIRHGVKFTHTSGNKYWFENPTHQGVEICWDGTNECVPIFEAGRSYYTWTEVEEPINDGSWVIEDGVKEIKEEPKYIKGEFTQFQFI